MKNKNIRKSRFTLIELLVVIGIIGILTGILLPAISGSMKEGKKTKAAAKARQLAFAVEAYVSEYGSLPISGTADIIDANADTYLTFLSGANARSKVFFENSTGTITNPFGGGFSISMDGDYDNEITANGETVSGKVAVYTICDGDTVKSWEK